MRYTQPLVPVKFTANLAEKLSIYITRSSCLAYLLRSPTRCIIKYAQSTSSFHLLIFHRRNQQINWASLHSDLHCLYIGKICTKVAANSNLWWWASERHSSCKNGNPRFFAVHSEDLICCNWIWYINNSWSNKSWHILPFDLAPRITRQIQCRSVEAGNNYLVKF